MITVGSEKKEVYSLGVNQRLAPETIETVDKLLLNANEETENIATLAIKQKKFDLHDSADNIIESYIERSRKSISERMH